MKFKRYAKRIVRDGAGYRLKLYFRSEDGHRCTLSSPMLLWKDTKSDAIVDRYTGKDGEIQIYTPEFRAEMEKHASRIAGITELGK